MSSGTSRQDDTDDGTPKRRGRRPGGKDTRAALVDAAREVFAESGYNDATVRVIATRAGVDPAMVNHWFGGKEALFTAAVQIPVDPAVIIPELLAGDREQLAERILHRFLSAWDEAGGGAFAALVRSVASHRTAVRMLREFVAIVVIDKLARALDMDNPDLRASLAASQIVGLGMARYVVELEPLASADHKTIVATIGPNLQRYLTGPLDI
ncbi:TetR family transcriptional regulator [Saccharopolyspora gloriosae]|uniref:TetR/AcrR family transcriptional regulator n=1 Tax=Saccharopolyspora gloriosae TaxID=455344 RepID=UPI001FB655E4|nr:TetR family transcriptional regulator [Saccharopolyspora gloriosae]